MAKQAVEKVFKALYPFQAVESDELSLKPGDLIDVCFVHSGDWGVGTSRRTKKLGSFPWSYVLELKQDVPPPVPREKKPTPAPPPQTEPDGPVGNYENVPVGGYGAPAASSQGAQPIRPTTQKNKGAVQEAAIAGQEDLEKQVWFAGGMSRQEAEEIMKGRENGTFLVRVSASRGGFALSVIYLGPNLENRHIKIHRSSDGRYGFTEEGQFDTVVELIKHFQTNSLQQYNAELETKLIYPFREAPMRKETAPQDDGMEEDLYMTSREALRKSIAKKTAPALDGFTTAYYSEKVRGLEKKKKAQDAILTLLKEQKGILQQATNNAQEKDRNAVKINMTKLSRMITDRERELQSTIQALSDAKLEEDRSGQSSMMEARQRTATTETPMSQIEAVPSDPSSSSFYVGDMDRNAAENALGNLPEGTYLIRKNPKRRENPYTISLRFAGTTVHAIIKYDGTRFGLADPLSFYSLQSFTEYYKDVELSSTIRTRLIRGINAQR